MKCPYKNCGRSFRTQPELKEHMQRRHKPEPVQQKTEQIETKKIRTVNKGDLESQTTKIETPKPSSSKVSQIS